MYHTLVLHRESLKRELAKLKIPIEGQTIIVDENHPDREGIVTDVTGNIVTVMNKIKNGGKKTKKSVRKIHKDSKGAKYKPTKKKKVHKIYKSPRGGKYYITKGRKVYL